ncbi:MAG: IS481 family transposase [Armatimonadetes bacterium]|nr:IS481 family transposase [Armatimonadota bacterium]
MDERRRMVLQVLDGSLSVSSAAREFGVSRPTVRHWVNRAKLGGLESMGEFSRRPRSIPRQADPAVVEQVLSLASEYEDWGARKIWALMGKESAPVCERTVDRILARHGRRILPAKKPQAPAVRFERENPNDLLQVDFKKMGPRQNRFLVLSVIDDCSRFMLGLEQVPDETLHSCWSVMWRVFGEYGLPSSVLCDNGSCFRNNATWRWSSFDLRLMLLDVRPIHGRPYHPQTQGKVERFHRTLEWELGRKLGKHDELAPLMEAFRTRYNWVRPHESVDLEIPGSLYKPSARQRPDKMPEPFFPKGSVIRRVGMDGYLWLKGIRHNLGRALAGLPVGLLYDESQSPNVVWGNFVLGRLSEFQTGKNVLS